MLASEFAFWSWPQCPPSWPTLASTYALLANFRPASKRLMPIVSPIVDPSWMTSSSRFVKDRGRSAAPTQERLLAEATTLIDSYPSGRRIHLS